MRIIPFEKYIMSFILLTGSVVAVAQQPNGEIQRPRQSQQQSGQTRQRQQRSSQSNATSTRSRDAILQDLINNMVRVEGEHSFSIGKYEVTQEEWEAVMGSNPSDFKGTKRPVESVSWDDCQEFISKLNSFTGRNFRLPTESEWEFAARGGNHNQGYRYLGSNNLDSVAWHKGNSESTTHEVGLKKPNELGLYDMSGNVAEFCMDRNESSKVFSPSVRFARGGSWYDENVEGNRDTVVAETDQSNRSPLCGFRLAEAETLQRENEVGQPQELQKDAETLRKEAIIQNLINNMVKIDGGTFKMGARGVEAEVDERPIHEVTLSSFCIGKYEVTQEEWEAVMGSNPSRYEGTKRPVEQVSWNDCQDFINKLNVLTGKSFRLPTEAEWEFAARGGNRSRGYKYAGGNNLSSVGWCMSNSGRSTHEVGLKASNELGLYDMSGNVSEWCADWYNSYSSSAQTNPTGASSGSYRVRRGGGWYNFDRNCRVSVRRYRTPSSPDTDLGLRLAL